MATQLFGWDCESGTLGNYFNNNVHQASYLVTDKSHSSTKSIYYDISLPTGGDLAVLAPHTFGAAPNFVSWGSKEPEIYLRWWMWVPNTIEGAAGGRHGWRLKVNGASQAALIDTETGTNVPGTGIGWGVVLFDYTGDAPPVDSAFTYKPDLWYYPFDQWFKFAFHCKVNTMGSSDGLMQVWINDVSKASFSNVRFRTVNSEITGWDWLALNTNFSGGNPAVTYWWIDDIEVWNGIPPEGGGSAIAFDSGGKRGARMIGLVPQGYR
jgi:hypothetical protein